MAQWGHAQMRFSESRIGPELNATAKTRQKRTNVWPASHFHADHENDPNRRCESAFIAAWIIELEERGTASGPLIGARFDKSSLGCERRTRPRRGKTATAKEHLAHQPRLPRAIAELMWAMLNTKEFFYYHEGRDENTDTRILRLVAISTACHWRNPATNRLPKRNPEKRSRLFHLHGSAPPSPSRYFTSS